VEKRLENSWLMPLIESSLNSYYKSNRKIVSTVTQDKG